MAHYTPYGTIKLFPKSMNGKDGKTFLKILLQKPNKIIMAINYVEHKDIDKVQWDNCISKSVNGLVFAYSWYLDTVCENWDALIEDNYKSVFPLIYRRKFGINYLFQPFFCSQSGVFSYGKINTEIINTFLSKIPKKFRYIDIYLNTFNNTTNNSFFIKNTVTYELDLIKPYETIVQEYSENNKRNINKANKKGVTIAKNIKPELIINMFKENRGKLINSYKEKDYQTLLILIYKLIYRKRAEIWGAYTKENNLCAGAFFIGSNNKAHFLFSAINKEGRDNNAMFLLIDRFIHENSNEYLILDFNGSNNPDIARFYKGFGATACVYQHIQQNNLPWFLKPFKKFS